MNDSYQLSPDVPDSGLGAPQGRPEPLEYLRGYPVDRVDIDQHIPNGTGTSCALVPFEESTVADLEVG